MNLHQLGEIVINVTPTGKGDLMAVKVVCQNRREELTAETAPFESVDNFCRRLKGMFTAIHQSLPRDPVKLPDEKLEPKKSWTEAKSEMKK